MILGAFHLLDYKVLTAYINYLAGAVMITLSDIKLTQTRPYL